MEKSESSSKKLFDFYFSADQFNNARKDERKYLMINNQPFTEVVSTGKQPKSNFNDLVLIAEAHEYNSNVTSGRFTSRLEPELHLGRLKK
jgi:hypothetical protein